MANLVTAALLDFEETPLLSPVVRATCTAGPNAGLEITRTLIIPVTNVPEEELAALTLSAGSFVFGVPSSGTIIGATSGSTITASGQPDGLTIDGAARTWAWDGTGSLGSGTLQLTETHGDASNSPRVSGGLAWEIVEQAHTAEIWVGIGDSLMDGLWDGVYAREVEDTDWPDVYQVRIDNSISSDTTPLDNLNGQPGGYDRFSPLEYFGKRRAELTGRTIYLVQCAIGGSKIGGADPAEFQWMLGGALHEGTIARANAAIAAVLDDEPGARFSGIVQQLGSNDGGFEPFYSNSAAAIPDMHDRIYMDGVSGETAAGNIAHVFITPRPERLNVTDDMYKIGWALRRLSLETLGGRFYVPVAGLGDLHHFASGIRDCGTKVAELLANTTPSEFELDGWSLGAHDPYRQELVATDETIRWYVSGADAADFEAVLDYYVLPVAGGEPESYRVRNFLQWKDGATHGTGTKNVTVNAKNGSGVVYSQPHTVTIGAATLTSPVDTADGHNAADLSVSCALSSGTLHWYVSTSATPPSAADLIAGTGAVAFGSQAVEEAGAQIVEASGLTADTEQFAHFVHIRADGQVSAIVSGDGFTTDPAPVSGDIEFVAHAVARYTGASSGATTDPINTSDADFLLVSISGYSGSSPTVSDSMGNTWTALTSHVDGESNAFHRHYYCAAPIKGSGHTFSLSGDAVYGRISASAWSGVAQSSPLDDETTTNENAGDPPFVTDPVVPTEDGSLVIAMIAGGTGPGLDFTGTPAFTVLDLHDPISGQTYRTGLAYYVQETAASIGAEWDSDPSGNRVSMSLTAFKPA